MRPLGTVPFGSFVKLFNCWVYVGAMRFDNTSQRLKLIAFNWISVVALNRIPVRIEAFFGIRGLWCLLFLLPEF